jgi:hypothetical protein
MRPSIPNGDAPRVRWSCRADGQAMVRCLSLYYEVRRDHGGVADLRIHTDREIHLWELPANLLQRNHLPSHLASELGTIPVGDPSYLSSCWDEGRCELFVGITSLHQFRSAYAGGCFSLLFRGRRLQGEYEFSRMAMMVDRRPLWLVRPMQAGPARVREIA